MLTALDASADRLDQHEKEFVAKVREHGWFRTEVYADDNGPGFSFTTGLWVNAKQPELIMFGMKGNIAHDVFWDLYRDGKSGKTLPLAIRTNDVFSNLPAYAFPVARRYYLDYLGWSNWFYGGRDNFPCLQIVWPDRAGIFPWEDGFDTTFVHDQPDLTESGWRAALIA